MQMEIHTTIFGAGKEKGRGRIKGREEDEEGRKRGEVI